MIRYLPLLFFLLFPAAAAAIEAPPGQTAIGAGQVLRGRFTQESQGKDAAGPFQASGHFILAPDRGLIWGIEKPMQTSTIITPAGSVQDIGGMPVKLPIKNLKHLYDIIGGALEGDWSGLETDFIITRSGSAIHWQMLLTPRPERKSPLPYISITVTGSHFVETIAMVKAKGGSDMLNFTDEVPGHMPLAAGETALFDEIGK
jgi:hypothetical protein